MSLQGIFLTRGSGGFLVGGSALIQKQLPDFYWLFPLLKERLRGGPISQSLRFQLHINRAFISLYAKGRAGSRAPCRATQPKIAPCEGAGRVTRLDRCHRKS